jgi:hypothetical protein
MGALRETYGVGGHDRDLVREAYMRLQVRAAQREFGDDVAVVCGAWHVPALRQKGAVAADRALLKGLPKVKADLTWVPWTHRRLSRASGYGAGIDSPGWYGHLFGAPDRPVERWMTKVAGLFREEDRIVSPAHVIEAVRLAETLAAMRGRPLPGLDRDHRRGARGDVRGLGRPAVAGARPARRRGCAGRGAAGRARGAVAARPRPAAAQAAAQTGGAGAGVGARPAQGDRRRAQQAAAPAAAAAASSGASRRVAGQHGYVPGDVAAALGAGVGGTGRRGRGVGHHRARGGDRQGGGGRDRGAEPRRRHRTRRALPAGRTAGRAPRGDEGPRRPRGPRRGRRPSRPGPARAGPFAALRRRTRHRHPAR